jgi:hypothetical protein
MKLLVFLDLTNKPFHSCSVLPSPRSNAEEPPCPHLLFSMLRRFAKALGVDVKELL